MGRAEGHSGEPITEKGQGEEPALCSHFPASSGHFLTIIRCGAPPLNPTSLSTWPTFRCCQVWRRGQGLHEQQRDFLAQDEAVPPRTGGGGSTGPAAALPQHSPKQGVQDSPPWRPGLMGRCGFRPWSHVCLWPLCLRKHCNLLKKPQRRQAV